MSRQLPVVAIRDAVHFPGLVNTLLVVREPSVRAIQEAGKSDHRVLVLSQRDMAVEEPSSNDLYEVGIVSEVHQTTPLPDGSLRVALRGLCRARSKRLVARRGCFFAEYKEIVEDQATGIEVEALSRTAIEGFMRVVEKNDRIPPESIETVVHAETAGLLADTIAHHLPVRSTEKQVLLEETGHESRIRQTLHLLRQEEEILDAKSRIQQAVDTQVAQTQREYMLREQLRVIQEELNLRDGRTSEIDEFRAAILASSMPAEARDKATQELKRLEGCNTVGPESLVMRNYLETLVALPWGCRTQERVDVEEAKRLLDERHFGLEPVKDRILDYLAVRQLRGVSSGSLLCFVGPPGVGKTSLGRNIADAMGRKFVRIALGGVRDEAEIRGHRRTYVGSMPGRIIQGLRTCGSLNPVIMLDEIDKLSHGEGGDPMSALLEALDPEQNSRFTDHYLDMPFDLSDVMFITTANLLDSVPPALRDRMEIVSFTAYTEEEKFEIAKRFLVPRQRIECGLTTAQLEIDDPSLVSIIRRYTREAGVRDLDRQIARIGRKGARAVAESASSNLKVAETELVALLGPPRFMRSDPSRSRQAGLSWAMVVSEAGGEVIPVEATIVASIGERPDLRLTGSLGAVMKESALAAVTFLQHLSPSQSSRDIHIHLPEASVPKDGPSAGLAVLLALASAKENRALNPGFAITGELTLLGRILPVGGVRDKLLAAIRAECTDVILPVGNAQDLDDLPPSARNRLRIHLVEDASQALAMTLA